MAQKFLTQVSGLLTALLILIGLLVQIMALPQLSSDLAEQYREYAGDEHFIQILLTLIIGSGQISLAIILLLLRRIRSQRLLSDVTLKWVQTLAASLLALAASFAVLMTWLINKNTLPPAIAAMLLVLILFASTMAFITLSLKAVLKVSIENSYELAAVI